MFPTPPRTLQYEGENIPGPHVVGEITKDFRLVPHPSQLRNEIEPPGQLSKKQKTTPRISWFSPVLCVSSKTMPTPLTVYYQNV